MIDNKELTVEEIEKANRIWELIENIIKCMPNCGITATRMDTNKCLLYVKESNTCFEASMENALQGIKSTLGIELMSDKEVIIQLQTNNKRLERQVEELQKEINKTNKIRNIKIDNDISEVLNSLDAEIKAKIENKIKDLEKRLIIKDTQIETLQREILEAEEVCLKWKNSANEELQETADLNFKLIEYLIKFSNYNYNAVRISMTHCRLVDKETGKTFKEGGVIYIRQFLEEETLGTTPVQAEPKSE